MKTTKSIWLGEYEGLLPVHSRDGEPDRSPEADPRLLLDHEPVSPHFELMPAHLTRTTPTAFFE